MDFLPEALNQETSDDCSFTEDMQKCPFLRNINKPTNLSFASQKCPFNGDISKHEALENEWLKHGICPIAKSYRAVSKVLPLIATVLRPPPGIKLKCPQAVVEARAALAKTALVKTVRPQPLPAKILVVGVLGIAVNIPLDIWREHRKKFSPQWFTAIHAAVPFIAMLRKSVVMPKSAMALTIAGYILGQIIGSRAEGFRQKAKSYRENLVVQQCGQQEITWDPLSVKMAKSSSSPATSVF